MQTLPGAVAKGGAEGLLCGVLPDGTGFALKCADGARPRARSRARRGVPRAASAPSFQRLDELPSRTAAARTSARSPLSDARENRCGNFVTPV